jgi:hypothetical protein
MAHREILALYRYPSPAEAGIRIPPHLIAARFSVGFEHALRGGQLDQVEYFRRSFRLGFRAAKLYVREVRRQRGILELPTRYRLRARTYWPES